MCTQDLSLENHDVDEARGEFGRTTGAPGALLRPLGARATAAQRSLAVVLLLQLVVSVVLVVLMASRSPINAHPDETLHLDAGRYFVGHWLPPPVGTPDAAPSYSKYGRSYVDEGDIVYWMLGAATALGERVGVAPPLAMRWFQVSLYCGLVAWTIVRARRFTPALGFLVLTHQVRYVFSYAHRARRRSDARHPQLRSWPLLWGAARFKLLGPGIISLRISGTFLQAPGPLFGLLTLRRVVRRWWLLSGVWGASLVRRASSG